MDMEYDEIDARLSREVAEKKFMEKDYVEANRFAERSRRLCPWLNSISIFIIIVDIYRAKEEVTNGISDWHRVLKLDGSATLAKKCENFCNLFEIVQSGRNNVVGAEGALQILSEAFCNVTDTFWTKCSTCHYQFQYASFRVYMEIVCLNCNGSFVAVPVGSGAHPMNQSSMSNFRRADREPSVVLALKATASKREEKQPIKIEDDGEGSSGKTGEFEEDGMEF